MDALEASLLSHPAKNTGLRSSCRFFGRGRMDHARGGHRRGRRPPPSVKPTGRPLNEKNRHCPGGDPRAPPARARTPRTRRTHAPPLQPRPPPPPTPQTARAHRHTHTHTQRLPFRLKTSAQERQREGERARSSLSLHFFFPSPRGAGRRAQASGPPHAGALTIFLRGRGPPLKKGFVNTSKAWWCEVLATGLPAAVVAGGGGRCPARQRGG